jgi:hypothetical protein
MSCMVTLRVFNVEASLVHLQAVLDVAERRPVVDDNFTGWLELIKKIASEAEELLDDFEIKRIQKSQQNKVSGFLAYMMKNLGFVDDDIYRLKTLLARLDKIASKSGNFFDLLKLNDSKEDMVGFLPEIQVVFHGREKEKDQLMSIIFPNEAQAEHFPASRMQEETRGTATVKVVCIVGEAGVGKTALAQVIYNHPNVKKAFNQRGWVSLSLKGLTQRISSRKYFVLLQQNSILLILKWVWKHSKLVRNMISPGPYRTRDSSLSLTMQRITCNVNGRL